MQTLSHLQARERIEQAQTGLLTAADLTALEAHLETCPECAAYQARFREAEAALRRVIGHASSHWADPDPGSTLRALARIRSRLRTRQIAGVAGQTLRTLALAGFAVAVAFALNWVFTSFSQASLQDQTDQAATAAPGETQAPAEEALVVPDGALPEPEPNISGPPSGESPAPAPEAAAPPILGYTPFSVQLRLTTTVAGAAVRAVAFSPDGETVAAAYSDGYVRIWRLRDGAMLASMEAHIKEATTLAYSSDGSALVTGGRDGLVKLWLPLGGIFIKTVYSGTDIVEAVQFSPNDELLAITLDNFSIALVQIKSGGVIESLPSLVRMSVNTDEGRNSTLTISGESAIWLDAENNTPIGLNVVGQNSRSNPVVLSADGTLLASASAGGLIHLWRIVDITIVEEDYDHLGNDLVWRFISGNLLYALSGHTQWANQLDFTNDGRYLVSASEDGTLIVWSLADGTAAIVLNGHEGPVNTVDVSPDDKWIASGSDDGTVRIWIMAEDHK